MRWDIEKDKRWNEPFNRFDEYSLKDGDIVIGMDGSRVGKNRAMVKSDDLPLLLAQRVACVRNTQLSCQKFLYYHIFSKTFEKYIDLICTGTSIPHISLKQIGDFKFNLPPLPTQRRIAAILSSLDAKIENNNKVNAKLEEIAQNLFKEWFVDFGPFKDGKFVDSELGPIPEGWRVETLEETCVEILRGYTPNYVNSSKYKILNQKVNKGSTLDKQYYKYNDENDQGFLNKLAQKGDVLINSLGQGTLGRIHLYTQNTTDVIIDQFITFLRTNIFSKSAYLAFYLSSMSGQAEIMSRITGSTGMWVLTINNIKKLN